MHIYIIKMSRIHAGGTIIGVTEPERVVESLQHLKMPLHDESQIDLSIGQRLKQLNKTLTFLML